MRRYSPNSTSLENGIVLVASPMFNHLFNRSPKIPCSVFSSIPALTIVIIVLVELITKKREENSTCRCNERQENTARDIGDKSWIEPALLQN